MRATNSTVHEDYHWYSLMETKCTILMSSSNAWKQQSNLQENHLHLSADNQLRPIRRVTFGTNSPYSKGSLYCNAKKNIHMCITRWLCSVVLNWVREKVIRLSLHICIYPHSHIPEAVPCVQFCSIMPLMATWDWSDLWGHGSWPHGISAKTGTTWNNKQRET